MISARIADAVRSKLDEGCATGVFPGASASIAHWRDGAWERVDVCAGVRAEGGDPATPDTLYDLASLTKPLVATTALRLYQHGRFPLDGRVADLIGEAEGMPVGERSWEEVLSHRAGLVAWEPFYERAPEGLGPEDTSAWFLGDLLPRYDAAEVGTSVYSDLGYILAGIAMQRAACAALDALVDEQVTRPLDLEEKVFFGASRADRSWAANCAPTGMSPWRGRELRGEVHDDNCAALGGVAGHAGMFGTAHGVAAFGTSCVAAYHGRRGALEEESIRFATRARPGGSHRLGWDGKSDEASAAGSRIGNDAFGHLGFTGTSLWCDPRRELVIVLLTNRVAVSDDNAAIRAFRPTFHDAVVEAFDGA